MNLSSCLALCLTLAVLLPAPARAMDGALFQQLKARVDDEHLSDAKLTLLKTAASTNTFTSTRAIPRPRASPAMVATALIANSLVNKGSGLSRGLMSRHMLQGEQPLGVFFRFREIQPGRFCSNQE